MSLLLLYYLFCRKNKTLRVHDPIRKPQFGLAWAILDMESTHRVQYLFVCMPPNAGHRQSSTDAGSLPLTSRHHYPTHMSLLHSGHIILSSSPYCMLQCIDGASASWLINVVVFWGGCDNDAAVCNLYACVLLMPCTLGLLWAHMHFSRFFVKIERLTEVTNKTKKRTAKIVNHTSDAYIRHCAVDSVQVLYTCHSNG